MPESLAVRVEGAASFPTLIYLPGLHGDWTLISRLSHCLRGRVRFVSFTYPRTLAWTLADYAAAIEVALAERDIRRGWLLGESFASQVTWTLVERARFEAEGVILAGGFVKHPVRWMVRPVKLFCRWSLLRWFIPCYRAYSHMVRQGGLAGAAERELVEAFLARRTELDLAAARHRLDLIAGNDPQAIARQTRVPVYALTGWLDPIVPWPFVRYWLRRHCPALRDYRVILYSDHNVLNMAAEPAARQILAWMGVTGGE
jgi:pimeloyl-ACP methyl ester carboxylesterase